MMPILNLGSTKKVESNKQMMPDASLESRKKVKQRQSMTKLASNSGRYILTPIVVEAQI
jgi:hypothetical protein